MIFIFANDVKRTKEKVKEMSKQEMASNDKWFRFDYYLGHLIECDHDDQTQHEFRSSHKHSIISTKIELN